MVTKAGVAWSNSLPILKSIIIKKKRIWEETEAEDRNSRGYQIDSAWVERFGQRRSWLDEGTLLGTRQQHLFSKLGPSSISFPREGKMNSRKRLKDVNKEGNNPCWLFSSFCKVPEASFNWIPLLISNSSCWKRITPKGGWTPPGREVAPTTCSWGIVRLGGGR